MQTGAIGESHGIDAARVFLLDIVLVAVIKDTMRTKGKNIIQRAGLLLLLGSDGP